MSILSNPTADQLALEFVSEWLGYLAEDSPTGDEVVKNLKAVLLMAAAHERLTRKK